MFIAAELLEEVVEEFAVVFMLLEVGLKAAVLEEFTGFAVFAAAVLELILFAVFAALAELVGFTLLDVMSHAAFALTD